MAACACSRATLNSAFEASNSPTSAALASARMSIGVAEASGIGGCLLVTRIAGLLLSAIAVQLVADSVRAFVAGEG